VVTASQGGSRYSALRPMERSRLYEQLVERLLTLIREMGLRPGQKLPPERELSAQLGVSRASIRQALVVLEVQGLVEVRHGEGASCATPRPIGPWSPRCARMSGASATCTTPGRRWR
jgi:DNA-binding FadR family transcriptional regulator